MDDDIECSACDGTGIGPCGNCGDHFDDCCCDPDEYDETECECCEGSGSQK